MVARHAKRRPPRTKKKKAPAGTKKKTTTATKRAAKKKATAARKPAARKKKGKRAKAADVPETVTVEEALPSLRSVRRRDSLTAKRDAFVHEMLVDGNGTLAAIRSGFAPKSAASTASQLLRDPKVAAALQRLRDARAERTGITADRVLLELARVALVDVRELFVWDEDSMAFIPSQDLSDDQAAAIQAVKSRSYTTYYKNGNRETRTVLELKLHDKVSALREIGKHLGVEEKMAIALRDPNSTLTDEELVHKGQVLIKAMAKVAKEDK